MIVVDSSALIAVLLGEGDAERFRDVLVKAERVYLSAATLLEASIVADSRGRGDAFDQMVYYLSPEIVPVDWNMAERARKAYRTFGRGNHKAALNFADCIAYATAAHLGLPLLFKGDDFVHTGIPVA